MWEFFPGISRTAGGRGRKHQLFAVLKSVSGKECFPERDCGVGGSVRERLLPGPLRALGALEMRAVAS